jgi:hypothetical protein
MATYYVRKNGSGTHTTIQGAIASATSGDTIDVGPGVFDNIDFYKDGITIIGAGKDQTEIRGVTQSTVAKSATWTIGATTINIPAGTAGFLPGHIITATGFAANTRIVQVNPTSIVISNPTTAARTTATSMTMAVIDAAVRWRGLNNTLKNVKVTAIQGRASNAVEIGAIYFRLAGLGAAGANNYWVENCEITAMGDYAIVCDASGVGGGTVKGCVINGQTFVGAQPAQVHAFGSLTMSVNILTSTTIQIPSDNLVDVAVGSPLLAITGLVASSTTVSAINGNVLTLNKALLGGVGTTASLVFTNIQFNVANVARQLVVFQSTNTAVQFLNNTINGLTGGGISYNTAVTVDPANSVVTGNTFNGQFKYGYALRVRGAGSTVLNNTNMAIPPNGNAGYLIGPTGSQVSGMNIGTNISVEGALVTPVQANSGDPIAMSMEPALVKSISSVASDPVFSDESNWNLVSYVWKHVGSSKRIVSSFKDFSVEKSISLKAGMNPGDEYQLVKIIISKADRTLKVIKRAAIPNASSFDLILK